MYKKALKYDVVGIQESDSEDDEFDVQDFLNKRDLSQRYMRDPDMDDFDSEEDSEDDQDSEDSDLSSVEDHYTEPEPKIQRNKQEERKILAEQTANLKCDVCPHKIFLTQHLLDAHLASAVCG